LGISFDWLVPIFWIDPSLDLERAGHATPLKMEVSDGSRSKPAALTAATLQEYRRGTVASTAAVPLRC